MKKHLTLILLLLTSLPTCLSAGYIPKDIKFNHFGLAEGLSNSTVFAINQDKDDNLWFATYDGVNRFNGYDFTVYRHDINDSTSIACDIARCIMVDEEKRLWIGTREGLSRYDSEQDKFINYYYQSGDGVNVPIACMASIGRNTLMLGTDNGILLFDVSGERFLTDTLSSAIHRLRPTAMRRQGDRVFIGSRRGVFTYTPATGVYAKLFDTPAGVGIHDILYRDSENIWAATEGGGLFLYSEKGQQLKQYLHTGDERGPISNFVRSLALDKDNNLWIGTYNGLNIYNEATDRFTSFSYSDVNETGLSQNSVRSIFCDSQGGVWLGTFWAGLNYYHSLNNRFRLMKHSPYINSISDNVVSCIVEDRDYNLWIGTNDGGLNFYDSHKRQFKKYGFQNPNSRIPSNDVKAVYVDPHSHLVYVGAHAGGLMVLNRRTGATEYYNKENGRLPSNNVYSIIPGKDNGLWIATLDNLAYYDKADKQFKVVSRDADGVKIPQSSRELYIDSKQRLWIGGERGMAVYNVRHDTLKAVAAFNPQLKLKSAFTNCFFEASSGTVWVGTRNGLFAFSGDGMEPTVYTTAQGLPSNVILGILEDTYGRLWLSTNQGLSCLTPESGKFRNFSNLDGLQSNQFSTKSSCRRANGDMLFGGVNGISIFHPETLVDNPYSPDPVINHLYVFNQEVLPGDETGILEKRIRYTDKIVLSSEQNSFALSFVVSNYVSGSHNTFAYKLEGYDNKWHVQNDIRKVSYTNLPAGNYTFMVKAANNDGKWNGDPTTLKIRILPVWYQTWWAITLFVLLVGLAILAIERFFWIRKTMQAELRMERLDKERLEEISQMKIRFYINISHELRTPLTLIVAPLQELLDRAKGHWEREQLSYIQRNTSRLLHLVNQQMDYRRAELGVFELRPSYANAYKNLLGIFLNYKNLAKRKEIDYEFTTELQDAQMLFDENYLDLIVNNLLSNAFKYTRQGSITLKLYRQDASLAIQVEDTGSGIAPERQQKVFERFYQAEGGHEGSGIGLHLVQRLVDLHHGTISLQSEVGRGSVFTVLLPQNEDAYTAEELQNLSVSENESRVYSTNSKDVYIGEEEDADKDGEEVENTHSLKGTVLVVEDNQELRQFLVSGLSSVFNVIEAENGQVALDILKEEEADLIVTDVMMPVMDGVKLCKLVKQNIHTCHIPVYMLSAKSDVKYQLEGLQVGADDYIAKPFSMKVLRTKIMNVLRTRYRVFERYSHTMEVEPEKITNNSFDEEMIRNAIAVVEKNMDNVEFSTEQFAREMNMSRSNLHLKLKAITGKSAIDFIHKIRFNRACQLLKEGKYTVAEVSFMVGYNSPSYFAARFKKFVGCLPTEYGRKGKNEDADNI